MVKKVSISQIVILIILTLIAMRVIIEPALMFFVAGKDAWLCYVGALFVQVVGIIFISYIIVKNKGKSFVEIANKYIGKIATKICLFLFVCFFLIKIVGIDYEMENFLLEAIYDELDWNFFIVPVFLVMFYIACKKQQVIARVAQIFLPIALIVLIYTLTIAFYEADYSNILPILSTPLSKIFQGFIIGLSQMGEFLFLFMFMEFVDVKKSKIIKIFTLTSVIVALSIVAFYIIFVSVFGDIAISLKEGIIRITQFYPNISSNLRIDGLSTLLWLPIVVLMSSICYFCCAKSLKHLFNLKSFNISIFIVFVIVIISKFLPFITSNIVFSFTINYFSYVSIFIQIFLPLILFLICLFKKEKNYEKTF